MNTAISKSVVLIFAGSALLSADILILKNGNHIDGTYLGGDSRTVKFEAKDRVTAYPVSDIDTVEFSSGTMSQTGFSSARNLPTLEVPHALQSRSSRARRLQCA